MDKSNFLCVSIYVLLKPGPMHFSIILGVLQCKYLITFANFNTCQCNQTHMCIDRVAKMPEFPRVFQGLCHWLNPECCEWTSLNKKDAGVL